MSRLARLLRRVFARVPASGLPPVFVAGRMPAAGLAPDHPRFIAP